MAAEISAATPGIPADTPGEYSHVGDQAEQLIETNGRTAHVEPC